MKRVCSMYIVADTNLASWRKKLERMTWKKIIWKICNMRKKKGYTLFTESARLHE